MGKAIIGMLKDSPKVRVVKAVDTVPAAGEWARSQGIEFTTDYAAVLADPNVGGVILCTPLRALRQQVVAAARAKKHVFCEKPLALTRRDALTEVEACKANGVVLAVGHEHRFKPVLQDVLRMVKSDELGAIQTTEATLTFELVPCRLTIGGCKRGVARWYDHGGAGHPRVGPLHSGEWSGGKRAGQFALGGSAPRGTPRDSAELQERRQRGDLLDSGTAVSIRFAVFGTKGWVEIRDKAHPQAPEGWLLTKGVHGGPQQTIEYPATSIVRANVEAFADAASRPRALPGNSPEMVANIATFEAIAESAESGAIVTVEG